MAPAASRQTTMGSVSYSPAGSHTRTGVEELAAQQGTEPCHRTGTRPQPAHGHHVGGLTAAPAVEMRARAASASPTRA